MFFGPVNAERPAEEWFQAVGDSDMNKLSGEIFFKRGLASSERQKNRGHNFLFDTTLNLYWILLT